MEDQPEAAKGIETGWEHCYPAWVDMPTMVTGPTDREDPTAGSRSPTCPSTRALAFRRRHRTFHGVHQPNASGTAGLLIAQPSASGNSPAFSSLALTPVRQGVRFWRWCWPVRELLPSVCLRYNSVDQTELECPASVNGITGQGHLEHDRGRDPLGKADGATAATISPRLTSGIPNLALSTATTKSQASMVSHPPARAEPLTAAMIGLASRAGQSHRNRLWRP